MAPKTVGWTEDKDPFTLHMIQDVNTGILPIRMKKAGPGSVKSQRKVRRPLADISTTPNRALSTNRPVQSSKKGASNVKQVGRKPLSDISNRGTASGSAVSPSPLEAIPEEEGFLHDHTKCSKTWDLTADKGFFLKTLCLDDDGISKELASPQRPKQQEIMMIPSAAEMYDPDLATWQQMDGHHSPMFPSQGSPSSSPSGYWDESMLPSFIMTRSPPVLLSEDH